MITINRLDATQHLRAQFTVAAHAAQKLGEAARLEKCCPLQRTLCVEATALLCAAKIMANDSAQFFDSNEGDV